MKISHALVSIVAAVIVGFFLGMLVRWPESPAVTADTTAAVQHPLEGLASAPVRLILFSDFQCEHCARLSLETLPALLERFPEGISIQYRQDPLPSHPMALLAAKAALAAQVQGRFEEMHRLMMRNQASLEPERMVSFARQLGLDLDRFYWDMDHPHVEEMILQDRFVLNQMGVQAVPALFVNGRLFMDDVSLDTLTAAVQSELAAVQVLAAQGLDPVGILESRALANGAPEVFVSHMLRDEPVVLPKTR